MKRKRSFPLLLALALPCLFLAACAGKKDGDAKAPPPVGAMYGDAAAKLDDGAFGEAAKAFNAVEQNYPYSQWATRAEIMSAYASYRHLKYDDALDALDRFIQLHPGDDSAPYAYYLKALCYYEQISDVGRDQDMTRKALDALKQVKTRFPDTDYARDAALKMDLTLDHLAGKEMSIGRFYLERKYYQAAINRFTRVAEQYQTTSAVPEALHRLVEAYLALGIVPEAEKAAAILAHNYPDSRWYKDTYRLMGRPTATAEKPSLFGRIQSFFR